MRWFYLPLLVVLIGCGSLQKWALRSSSPVFQKSSDGLMEEGNWDFFQASAPANLKFLELLWLQDQDNHKLLALLVKGYAGYGYAVHETIAFGDTLAGVEDSKARKDAIYFYTRALDYGLLYLSKNDIKAKHLLGNEMELAKRLKKELSEKDIYALLYTAQAWGSLINLQKDNVALVSQIPKVKVLFDEVCRQKPDIDQNICAIFFAQYEAARPKMLGGNPELAQKLYQEAMAKHPQNLLIRMNYIEFMLLPSYDQEKYEVEAKFLREEFAKWEDQNRDELKNNSPYRKSQKLNLYNSIAKKRFEFVEKNKAKIF